MVFVSIFVCFADFTFHVSIYRCVLKEFEMNVKLTITFVAKIFEDIHKERYMMPHMYELLHDVFTREYYVLNIIRKINGEDMLYGKIKIYYNKHTTLVSKIQFINNTTHGNRSNEHILKSFLDKISACCCNIDMVLHNLELEHVYDCDMVYNNKR